MNYVYQDKSTMNPGVTVLMIYNKDGLNKMNKDIISRIGHLSVPTVFYESCNYKKNLPNISVKKINHERLDKDNIIKPDIFDDLINRSSVSLPTNRKTRKNIKPIIRIKTHSGSKNKSKKQINNYKKRNRKRQTKKKVSRK